MNVVGLEASLKILRRFAPVKFVNQAKVHHCKQVIGRVDQKEYMDARYLITSALRTLLSLNFTTTVSLDCASVSKLLSIAYR